MLLATSSSVYLGLGAAFLAAILFGFGDFGASIYGKKITPIGFAGSTYLLEVPILFGLLALSGEFGSVSTNAALIAFGSLGTLAFFLLVIGLTKGHVSVVMALSGLFALIVPAITSIVIGESSSWLIWVGLFVTAIAIVCITQAREAEEHEDAVLHARGLRISIVLGAIAGICAGAYFTSLGHFEAPTLEKLCMLQVSGFIAAVIYFAIKRPKIFRTKSFLYFLPLICLAYNVAQALIPFATDNVSIVVTNIIVNLYPGVTIGLAMIFTHEKTSRVQNVGLLVAVLGVVLVSIGLR